MKWVWLASRLLFYVFLIFGISMIIESDMYKQSFKEDSMTELFQVLFLLGIALISGIIAYKFPKLRVFSVMFSAFALVSFIRENDAFLENNLFDKGWQVLALLVLIPSLIYFFKNLKIFGSELKSVANSLPLGIILTGTVILHLFSRLYGRKKIWKAFMGEENFMRSVKDASEESIELLAYCLMFIGTIELYRFAKRKLN